MKTQLIAKPVVSFVVIAYNEERHIERTITSILMQDALSHFEVLVVDDGSRDGTATLVKQLSLKYEEVQLVSQNTNQGRGAARARGIKEAQGEQIAFVDADIVLPPHWYRETAEYLLRYDAVGGIAMPDGDVNYVYGLLELTPKVIPHAATVSGGNGLYRKAIFSKVAFEQNLRDGEDIALNHALGTSGYTTLCIPNLVAEHREDKTYQESLRWLYQSGKGATRQLLRYRLLRLPDVALVGFIIAAAIGVELNLLGYSILGGIVVLAYIFASSTLHIGTRFVWKPLASLKYLVAILIQSTFILAYYCGRIIGFVRVKP